MPMGISAWTDVTTCVAVARSVCNRVAEADTPKGDQQLHLT
jgi:hypothetical protein